MEKIQVTIQPGALDAEARDAFARLLQPGIDTAGGLQSVDNLLAGAQLYEWIEGGAIVARHALLVRQHDHGAEGVIVAAAGASPLPFAQSLAIMEGQFLDVRAVTVYTRRRGMVKQLARCGYGIDGFILRKRVTRGTA